MSTTPVAEQPSAKEIELSPDDLLVRKLREHPLLLKALERAITSEAIGFKPANKRPKGTYYNEVFALQLKPFLDEMLSAQRKHIIFQVKDFRGVRKQTLYLRIFQSFQYLYEGISQEFTDKYGKLKQDVIIGCEGTAKEGNEAITIRWKSSVIRNAGALIATVADEEQTPFDKIKLELHEYLTAEDHSKAFEEVGLELTQQEILEIKLMVEQLTNVAAIVEHRRIKVVFL